MSAFHPKQTLAAATFDRPIKLLRPAYFHWELLGVLP